MPRPPATPEQKREARNRIRRAATEVVAEEGPANVTVRKVAARAEVSVGTVYSHFDSLGDLLRSLWIPVIAEADRKLAAAVDGASDPIERVRVILGHYVDLALGNQVLHRSTLLFVRPANVEAPQPLPLDELVFHRLLVEAVTDGQAAGALVDGDPTQLAQMLWAGVHGALALPVNNDIYDLEPADQQARLMIDTMVGALAVAVSSSPSDELEERQRPPRADAFT